MPTYYYRAKTKNAQTVESQITADHKDMAVEKIHEQGLIPVVVYEVKKGQRIKPVLPRRVKLKEIYVFSRQLAGLLKAGVPILRSLETLGSQTRDLYFKGVVENMIAGIRGGKTFSDCLMEYPRIFSGVYATLVKAGEESGRLKESLLAMTAYLKGQEELLSKIRMAVAYPILMMVFGTGTVIFILTYVMPQITRLFVDLHQTLPLPTVIVMSVSDFLIHRWWILALAVLALTGLASRWSSSPAGQRAISRMSLKVPFYGAFLLKVEITRFCRTLELLLQSSVSLIRALQLAIPIVRNYLIREQLVKCQDDIVSGRSFGLSLKDKMLIPAILSDIVAVGEESGRLADAFGEIAESYEQETQETVKIMTTLFEPLMIIAVGSVIGFIVIAMLLPIFQLDVFAK